MIAGWREIGKLLGFYAPEVKKVELTGRAAELRAQYEAMTDAQLLAIAEGETCS